MLFWIVYFVLGLISLVFINVYTIRKDLEWFHEWLYDPKHGAGIIVERHS